MRTIFNAGTALVLAALITGHVPPLSPGWRAVAVELHQAEPQAKVKSQMKATVVALFQARKG